MRGDYVAVFFDKAAKVAEIYEKGIVTMGGGVWTEDEIQPVPLTPEMLEKNGFSLDDSGDWYQREVSMKERNFWLNIAFRDDGVSIYDLDVFTGTKFSICMHLNYVHELQHALKLCGIDKEITL